MKKDVNKKKIGDMLKALKQAGIPWQQTTVPNKENRPPIFIPSVWTVPPRGHELDKDWKKQIEDQGTVAFMQECRERTASMKDGEKCARCKLRFRCYTEIKIEKKRKTGVRKPEGLKPGTQPIRRKSILYSQSMSPITTDKTDKSIDWLKIIRDVAENTRPDTKKEI